MIHSSLLAAGSGAPAHSGLQLTPLCLAELDRQVTTRGAAHWLSQPEEGSAPRSGSRQPLLLTVGSWGHSRKERPGQGGEAEGEPGSGDLKPGWME